MRPRQVATLLAVALFATFAGGATQTAIAGPVAAVRPVTAQVSSTRSNVQAKVSPKVSPPPAAASPAEASPVPPRVRVYLFRGAMGLIFSRGMDSLAEKIERAGVTANVYEFTVCDLISSAAIEKYKQDPAPIILIGHSMGGRCALQFAEKLRDQGIPASLVVSIDPAHLSPEVPLNVERFINIFLSKDVLGGGDIKPTQGFQGHYASYDMAGHDEVSHITIDKADIIHRQLVDKIVQLAATPSKTDDEVVPLRYAVPPGTDIELWDSGTAIAAHAGDTLQTLAAQYQLPLWSLTQINHIPDNAPLAEGQRVIVPRHLLPPAPAPVAKPVSSRR